VCVEQSVCLAPQIVVHPHGVVSPDTVWKRDQSSGHLIFGPNGLKNRPRKPRNADNGVSNYLFRDSLAEFIEDFSGQPSWAIATLIVLLHKFGSQRPMLYGRDHILADAKANNSTFICKDTFRHPFPCRRADGIKGFSQPQLPEGKCLVTRKM